MTPAILRSRAARSPRGTVLMAVLVVVVIAAMVGTTAIYVGDGEIAATRTTVRATQSRALAWSAVQMAMAELLAQREAILDGGRPTLTREFSIATDSGTPVAARLVEITPGETAAPEAGKLDLNAVSSEILVATGMFDAPLAGRIIAAAAERPFASIEELLAIDGITAEMVYGPAGSAAGAEARPGTAKAPAPTAGGGSIAPAGARLGDLFTTYAFDPSIQAGVGDRGADHRGKRRINIATEWSDALGKAVSNRFGKDAAKVLEQVMKGGTTFAKTSDLVAVLRRLNVPPADWGPILDTFGTTDDEYVIGLVDLSTAPAAVLACVPGISPEAAGQIVRDRERLGSDARRSVVWPVIGGILNEEQFQTAVDHLTTRCLQWRVRVEAGYLKPGDRGTLAETLPRRAESGAGTGPAASPRPSQIADGGLTDRVVYEAVIDVSSRRPRVAYLRDVTMLPGAYAMYLASAGRPSDEPPPDSDPSDAPDPADQVPEGAQSGLDMDTGLEFDSLDFGGDGQKSREGAEGADPTIPTDGSAPPGGRDGATSDKTPAAGAGTHGSSPVDRRIGRWTTGSRGGGSGGGGGGGGEAKGTSGKGGGR